MKLSERVEEILEMLWVSLNEKEHESMDVGIASGEAEIDELAKAGFIKKPIPEGECCRKSKENISKVISSVINLGPNQKGKVAYIQTKDHKKLQKLMAMGILPGMSVTVIQRYPAYVLQVGQSQFAVDKELAGLISVRLGGK